MRRAGWTGRTLRGAGLAMLVAAAWIGAAPATAQPPGPGGPPGAGPGGGGDRLAPGPGPRGDRGDRGGGGGGDRLADRPVTRESLKAALQFMLRGLRDRQAKIEEAIGRLEQGEDPEQVRSWLEKQRGRLNVGGDGLPGAGPRPPREGPGSGDGAPGGASGAPLAMLGFEPEPGLAPPRKLTAGERDGVMASLRAELPAVAARVEALGAEAAPVRDRLIDGLAPRVKQMVEAKEADPALHALRKEDATNLVEVVAALHEFGRARRGGDSGKIEAARESLRQRLSAQLDIRLRLQGHEIERLDTRVQRMRGDLDRFRSGSRELIEKKLEELSRQREGDGAGRGPANAPRGPRDRRGDRPPSPQGGG